MEIGPWKYSGETILLLVQTILKLFGGLGVCLGSWWNKTKQLVQDRNCFVLLLSLTVIIRLSRSLRVSATQDTDKPEIQPVSEPKSLHSCVLSCVRLGQA